MRVACLRVADLPLAAELRAHPELAGLPVVLAAGPEARAEVFSVSPEAAQLGLRGGVTLAHARNVCADVRVRVASPTLLHTAREALLDAALSFGPRAKMASGETREGAVFLDATGVDALFRSESGFGAALAARARALGLPGAVAVASSCRVAHLVARELSSLDGEVRVLPTGSELRFLAPLAIDVLDLSDDSTRVLTRFGVRRVGELLALPRRDLSTRLPAEALQLLARLRGEEAELPLPVVSRAPLREALDLEHPVDRIEPLSFAIRGALSRLLTRLEARHLACGDLFLSLALQDGGRDARRVGVAAPTRDARTLLRLAVLALEAHPPAGPVDGIALETEGLPLAADQLDLFRPAGPAPAALDRTLAELASLCGADRVGAPQVADDLRPEAFAMQAFRLRAAVHTGSGEELGAPTFSVRALRPPVPAEVRVRGGRPDRIRSAVANGRVVGLAGPWRTTGLWWSDGERFAYDHFDVQTDDTLVVRLRLDHVRKAWCIDAIYD